MKYYLSSLLAVLLVLCTNTALAGSEYKACYLTETPEPAVKDRKYVFWFDKIITVDQSNESSYTKIDTKFGKVDYRRLRTNGSTWEIGGSNLILPPDKTKLSWKLILDSDGLGILESFTPLSENTDHKEHCDWLIKCISIDKQPVIIENYFANHQPNTCNSIGKHNVK